MCSPPLLIKWNVFGLLPQKRVAKSRLLTIFITLELFVHLRFLTAILHIYCYV